MFRFMMLSFFAPLEQKRKQIAPLWRRKDGKRWDEKSRIPEPRRRATAGMCRRRARCFGFWRGRNPPPLGPLGDWVSIKNVTSSEDQYHFCLDFLYVRSLKRSLLWTKCFTMKSWLFLLAPRWTQSSQQVETSASVWPVKIGVTITNYFTNTSL